MSDLHVDARRIFDAAVRAVRPARFLAELDIRAALPRPISAYRRVAVVGAGKACNDELDLVEL